MPYTIVVLESAKEDLLYIGRYIAQDSPANALKWMDLLEERARSLAEMPMRGRVHKSRYRVLTIENGYQIYYRVDQTDRKVAIVHFYSPYQNWDTEV